MHDLLLPLEWVVSGGFWAVLFKCLLICPGIPQILGLVFESRWVPWGPKYQFWAFMPGNPVLAVFIAGSSTTFDRIGIWWPEGFHQSVLVGAFLVYVALNIMDLKSHYTRDQMSSATKIYHNSLYFWYGYLIGMVAADMLASYVGWQQKALIMLPALFWIGTLVKDGAFTSEKKLEDKFKFAHTDNLPIWKTGWRLRRRTPEGYVLVS